MTIQELTKLSINDIDLILRDQTDLYTPEEIDELTQWKQYLIQQEERAQKEEQNQRRLKVIKCPKCDGPNDSANTYCMYCGYQFKESDYYTKEESHEDTEDSLSSTNAPIGRLLGGFLFTGGGVASIVYGNAMNNSIESQWNALWNNGSTDPGTIWIIIGVAVAVVGLIMLVSAFFTGE